MVENTRPVQTRDRDPFDRFDEAINDPRLYETSRYEQPYALPYDERSETFAEARLPQEPVPLFLSTYEEEQYQQVSEYAFASGHRKQVRVSRIVTAVVAVSAIGGLLALFSIDQTRSVMLNVRASLGGGAPVQFGAAEQDPAQASAQLPPRVAAPAAPEPAAALPDPSLARRNAPPTANALASASPTRDEITAAYQSALKGKVAVPEPVAREAAREVEPVVPAVLEAAPPPPRGPLRQGVSIRTNLPRS